MNINPEKVMRNEELIMLRGGYGEPGKSTWACRMHEGEDNFLLGFINLDECDYSLAITCCTMMLGGNEVSGGCSGFWEPDGYYCS